MKEFIIHTISSNELEMMISKAITQEMDKIAATIKKLEHKHASFSYLTRHQSAKLLGISLPTLHKWTKKGLIPAYRMGSRVRYKQEELTAILDQLRAIKYKN